MPRSTLPDDLIHAKVVVPRGFIIVEAVQRFRLTSPKGGLGEVGGADEDTGSVVVRAFKQVDSCMGDLLAQKAKARHSFPNTAVIEGMALTPAEYVRMRMRS